MQMCFKVAVDKEASLNYKRNKEGFACPRANMHLLAPTASEVDKLRNHTEMVGKIKNYCAGVNPDKSFKSAVVAVRFR